MSFLMKKAVVAAAVLMVGAQVFAASVNTSFNATANVIAKCMFNSALGDLAFGEYDPTISTDNDAATTVTVQCTRGTNYTLKLDGGGAADIAARTLLLSGGTRGVAGEELSYQLYTDAARTTVWGDGTSGSTVTGTAANAAAINVSAYGRITASQVDAKVGNYSDTITVTAEY